MKLSDLDLAALLCSRVCHDIISPVGAISNGIELMDDKEVDEATREAALDMIRSSAKAANAKLKFCRIAFGASGSAGAHIDLTEAGQIAKDFAAEHKAKLDWQAPRENRPKQEVKLLLNMLVLSIKGIPKGGVITVKLDGQSMDVRAKGERAKVPQLEAEVLADTAAPEAVDARLIQPYYTRLLAENAGYELKMFMDGDDTIALTASL
jgi:histidine phosphotransferase ChpT